MNAVDLADAVLQTLRGSPCAAAFGDTWNAQTQSGLQKFFGEWAAQPQNPSTSFTEPYLIAEEVGETYQYMSPQAGNVRPFIADGTLQITIYQTGRTAVRLLGIQVAQALNDVPIYWPGAQPMYLRLASARFVPLSSIGPGVATVFCRVLTFSYEYAGSI